jgi:hypothetical protein
MGRFVISMLLLFAIYAGRYAIFRQTNQDVWPNDETYVIFPSGVIGRCSTQPGARRQSS